MERSPRTHSHSGKYSHLRRFKGNDRPKVLLLQKPSIVKKAKRAIWEGRAKLIRRGDTTRTSLWRVTIKRGRRSYVLQVFYDDVHREVLAVSAPGV